jgi:hypothetical protein
MSFRLLATIEVSEQTIGNRHQVVVLRQVVRRQGHATRKFGDKFGPIPIRQRFEFFDQLLGGVRHGTRVPRCVLHVKFVVDSEA